MSLPHANPPKLSGVAQYALTVTQRLVARRNPRGLARVTWAARRLIFPSGPCVINYRRRFYFLCDGASWYSVMTACGFLHRALDHAINACLSPSDTASTFIDIGANRGFVSLLACTTARARRGTPPSPTAAHCFEPNPLVYEQLLVNRALNPALNISTRQLAVGAEPGLATLTVGLEDTNSSLVPQGLSYVPNTGTTNVRVTTLDQYCSETGVRPALIKIDVEGFEPAVLTGAAQVLAQAHPYLIVEVNPRALAESGQRPHTLIRQIMDLGYTPYYIDPGQTGIGAPLLAARRHWHTCPAVLPDDLDHIGLCDIVAAPST